MGRYYYGDITGKCWFAVQSSNDASSFGGNEEVHYRFYGCGDDREYFGEENELVYCETCYTSLEHHLEEIKDTLEVEGRTWYAYEFGYAFRKEDIPNIQLVLTEVEKEIGSYIKSFEWMDSDTFEYDITTNSSVPTEKIGLLARWCLGKQILACVLEKDECIFTVEL